LFFLLEPFDVCSYKQLNLKLTKEVNMIGELMGGTIAPEKNVTICACICRADNDNYANGYCEGVLDHS